MGFFGDLFKKQGGETVSLEQMLSGEQMDAQKLLSQFAKTGKSGAFTAGQDFGGALGNFESTGIEKQGLGQLERLLASGSNKTVDAGANTLTDFLSSDTFDLGGKFDAFNKLLARERTQGSDAIKRNAAVTGDLFSSSLGGNLTDLEEGLGARRQNVLADLINQNLDRKLGAANSAVSAGATQENVDQGRINLSQTAGSLERVLKDAEARTKYNDFLRKQNEKQGTIDAAKTLFNRNIPYGKKSITGPERPSVFGSILGEIDPVVGSYNQHKYGYDVGQTSVGDAGKYAANVFSGGTGAPSAGGSSGGGMDMGRLTQLLKAMGSGSLGGK